MCAEVVISPATTASPVVTSVSHATRPCGSWLITSSSTASEIWSAILSGWPSVTDSEVNKKFRNPSLKTISPSCFFQDQRFVRELVINLDLLFQGQKKRLSS